MASLPPCPCWLVHARIENRAVATAISKGSDDQTLASANTPVSLHLRDMTKKPARVRIRLKHRIDTMEQQHAELLERLARLQTDTSKTRAKHDLLAACLDLLHWLHQQQHDYQDQPDARSHAVPVDELLQLEQLLQLAPLPSPETDAEAPSAAMGTAPDAWRTCPMAPRHDPLVLLREVFQRPPHPGVGPDTTLQHLQDGYTAFCGELALHMRVLANPQMSAAAAAASAARARGSMLDWYGAVVELLYSPYGALPAQLLATNCSTGEAVTSTHGHGELQQLALQRLALSPEQSERIALCYEVLAQLHQAGLQEVMAAGQQGSLDKPAAQLFGPSALPVGLLQPSAGPGAAASGSRDLREQHQSDVQRLRVAFKKAHFWDSCLCACFVGALTINQLCELALSMFPFPMRFNMLARQVAAMHRENQEQQEQQAAAARQQQEAQGKKGRRRQTLDKQPSGASNNTAKSSTGIAVCGSAG